MAVAGQSLALAPQEESWAHFAVIERADPQGSVLPAQTDTRHTRHAERDPSGEWQAWQAWQAACRRLTARVEQLSPTRALLDLGICTDAEASDAVQGLLVQCARLNIPARAAIAPTGCLAELAVLRAPARVALRLIAPDDVSALLRTTPVALLPRLRVAGVVGEISPVVVERLHRYGLRTLGHLARLGELALRRQFGARLGSILVALAAGRDPRPLSPTPPSAALWVRLRVPSGAIAPEQVPAVLAHLAGQVANHLRASNRQASTLQLGVQWETGARQQVACTLRQPTSDPAALLDALQRLLAPLLTPGVVLCDLRLKLLDFAPLAPEQAAFWHTQTQRRAALDSIAATLARRHGKPLLLAARLLTPDAVFSEDRHTLQALTSAGADAGTTASSTPPYAAPIVPAGDTWRDVPLRIHWW